MVIIDKKQCIGCGKCVEECVAKKLEIAAGKAVVKGDCLQCGHCVAVCGRDAISIPEYDMDDIEPVDGNRKISPELLLSCIKSRRSIRDYSAQKIDPEKLKTLAEAGRYSATANNGQFHKFVFVQEKIDVLKELVWNYIDDLKPEDRARSEDYDKYKNFLLRKKEDLSDDYLFRNAPAVLFIVSERMLDAGMAAQNIELMAVSLGMGVLYNGFLARIADANIELKRWLGIENKTIRACMLIGYPKQKYLKTAPRKKADIAVF